MALLRSVVLCAVRLSVTANAVFLILNVKPLLTVMAFSAEITFGHFAHFHFVRSLGHLKNLIMTASAFETLSINMVIVTENDW